MVPFFFYLLPTIVPCGKRVDYSRKERTVLKCQINRFFVVSASQTGRRKSNDDTQPCQTVTEMGDMSLHLFDPTSAFSCTFSSNYMSHAARSLSLDPGSSAGHFPRRPCLKNYRPFNRMSRQSIPRSSPPRWEETTYLRRNLCSRLPRRALDTSPLLQLDVR